MKKILLLIVVLAFTGLQFNTYAVTAAKKKKHSRSKNSSEVRFGLKAGINLANMSIKDASPDPSNLIGFHLGAIAEYSLSESFAVEGGLLYSSKGCKSEVSYEDNIMGMTIKVDGDSKFNPSYLEIPINGVFKIPAGDNYFSLFAGPYLGFGIGGKVKGDYTVETNIPGFDPATMGYDNTNEKIKFGSSEEDDIKPLDFGLNLGAGFEVSNFIIRAQYGIGLANLATYSEGEMKNKVIGFSVGYMFGN